MNCKKNFLYLILLLVIFLTGCDTLNQVLNLQKPTAKMTGLSFKDVKLSSATALFDIEVNNPYSVPLPLLDMDYGLSSNDNQLFEGVADLQTTIPAKSKKTVSLPANINYLCMLKALKDIRPGTNIPYKADLGLSVDTPAIGLIRLPIKKEGEVYLPSVSDMDTNTLWKLMK